MTYPSHANTNMINFVEVIPYVCYFYGVILEIKITLQRIFLSKFIAISCDTRYDKVKFIDGVNIHLFLCMSKFMDFEFIHHISCHLPNNSHF